MKTGRMKKHRYSNEFKITAVRLAEHPDIQTQDVATALNIHPFMLSRWKKEVRDGVLKGSPHAGLKDMEEKVAEQKQIRALERRLRKAEIEKDLLKKAIQYNLEKHQTSSNS